MSSPESVSSRIASRGARTAIWKISFRFFSPPEKPWLTERDSIASEYVTDYAIVFEHCLPAYEAALALGLTNRDAIVQMYLVVLSQVPDTLIARKAGWPVAQQVSARATAIIMRGGITTPTGRKAIGQFDRDLRAEGNRLNPGTSADLVAATLFAAQLMAE